MTMNDIAIRVENLSTHHPIGQRECYKGLRDIITDVFAAPFRRLHENSKFEIRNVSPAAFCLVVPSRFTFHVLRCHSAIRNPKSAMSLPLLPCSRAQRCPPTPLHLCTPAQTSPPDSRFTFCGVIPHSTFRIPHLKGPRTLHLKPCTSRIMKRRKSTKATTSPFLRCSI